MIAMPFQRAGFICRGNAHLANLKLLLRARGADAGTQIVDRSPNAYAVTANGNAQVDRDTVYYANSMLFDGAGDDVSLASAADWAFLHTASTKWTFRCWYNALDHGNIHTLLSTSNGATAGVGIYLYMTTSRTIGLAIYYGSSGNFILNAAFSNVASTAGTWNHLCVTYDHTLASNNALCWINGGNRSQASKTANTPSAANPTRALRVGSIDGTTNPMKGRLLDVEIYDDALFTSADTTVPVHGVSIPAHR